ncbi:MAG: hypothetical protein NBKEAIPA_02095 [Nitrospirae bacterium]|nr:MAG: hypothetical protein UZ03_NOB001001774 [Nitrospira sp. OLB3]MBV6470180.1 hypothetical protein [Nitrospirota bacterium]
MGQERRRGRDIARQRVSRVILHPLTEVGIGMFVAVVVGRRQFVVNLQRDGKRRHREQERDEQQRNERPGFELPQARHHDPVRT